ncbi:glycosyltransferase family 2 protein [Escherichia coli]|nr:glycosyltransferase family 2 protein [Escherichia coli]ALN46136.1 hypothetical protein ASE18_08635 [Escherichia coli]AUT31359.1 putative colanic acid biosynthesis glycosyltransferase WcaA [Escherichia coli]EFE4628219.1 glycosyltransferase family 2 protein [Escherichia coli]EGA0153765.1 glycosyltransferase family 2 protein [Escherichia coli]EGO3612431.1 glycosyltransferase family 2 protein [Escherichia coli]
MNFINIEQPLVSIIMACYNSIKTIDESISSVINQDYKNFELIIADDNSTDGTYEFIISKYSSSDKVKIIRNEYNKGVSGARNSALRKAKGRYICFLDSDDLWETTKLSTQITYMLKHNVTLSYSDYTVFVIKDGHTKRKKLKFCEKVSYKEMLKTCSFGCLTVCYDVNYFGKVYFDDVVKEDYVCWLSLLKRVPYAYNVGVDIARYRQQKQSLSSNKIKEIKKQFYVISKIEGNNSILSIYNLLFYIFNGLIKRV